MCVWELMAIMAGSEDISAAAGEVVSGNGKRPQILVALKRFGGYGNIREIDKGR